MAAKDDWRLLLNDTAHLQNEYMVPTDGEELARLAPQLSGCVFCGEALLPTSLRLWFVPGDLRCCVCGDCYNDFREKFAWKKLDGIFKNRKDRPAAGFLVRKVQHEKAGRGVEHLSRPSGTAQN